MPEREPLTEPIRDDLAQHAADDELHAVNPEYVLRLLDEHAAQRERIAELEAMFQQTHGVHVDWVAKEAQQRERIAELEQRNAAQVSRLAYEGLQHRIAALEAEVVDLGRQRDRALSVVECDRCGREKFCRVPPPDWEQEPICLGCYDRACAIDAPDAESWPKLKPWGSTRAEALAAHDKERS